MNFEELMNVRYSCRKFKTDPIPHEFNAKLETALISAPTACNRQPWNAVFVTSVIGKNICKTAMPQHFEAPLYVILCSDHTKSFIRTYDNKNFADIDATIAGTQLMLEVTNLGLATVWVGAFDPTIVKSNFPICSDKEIIGIFPIGYPDVGPCDSHFTRKQSSDLITYV